MTAEAAREIYDEALLSALHDLPEPLSPRRSGRDGQKRGFWRAYERRWGQQAVVRPFPIFDPRPDRLLPSLHLVRLADSGARPGLIKAVKERPADQYPPELEGQMEYKEPQFILRNIPRVERYPDDRLEFDRSRVMARDWHGLVQAVHSQRYARPEFLGELNLARVMAYREGVRRLFFETDWTRHFSAELNRAIDGPLWRYDPDAPRAGEATDETGR